MKEDSNDLIIMGKNIAEDEAGNICLHDLWRLAGSPPNTRPADWKRFKMAQGLMTAIIEKTVCITHGSRKNLEKTMFYTVGRGRAAKTFAHPVLALAYAENLNHKLGLEVREIFLRYKSNDISLAEAIIENLSSQCEYDELRILLRDKLKRHNKMLSGAAKEAGVNDYKAFNGAGLQGLYGGMNKSELLSYKGLSKNADHLNHANHEELAANYFKATQAEAKIRRENACNQIGQRAANNIHKEVGQAVRETIKELGGTMPEDEPAIENIKEAQKRLKTNKGIIEGKLKAF